MAILGDDDSPPTSYLQAGIGKEELTLCKFPTVTSTNEISSIVMKGKHCYEKAKQTLDLICSQVDHEQALAHLKNLSEDGKLLVKSAECAKYQCENERDQLCAEVLKLEMENRDYENHVSKLKDDQSSADIQLCAQESKIRHDTSQLERAELELHEAVKSLEQAEKKARKTKLIGGALGALVGVISKGDIGESAEIGFGLGGLVSEIEGNMQKKRDKVDCCKADIQKVRAANLDTRTSLENIEAEMHKYEIKIKENRKLIDFENSEIDSIERLIKFHQKSEAYWGLLISASQNTCNVYPLEKIIKGADDAVDLNLTTTVKTLTAAKSFFETWMVVAGLDIKELLSMLSSQQY